MGMNEFAPYLKINGCFIVRNVTPDRGKTIKIFNYPILFNQTRDLLQIPGVAESDIRASLLKGTLRHKILAQDIVIECSDIDLLQFNEAHKAFLQSAGITDGLEVGVNQTAESTLRQLILFIDEGPADGFASGAYKEVIGQPFPTSVIWYEDSTKTQKIVEKSIIYYGNNLPQIISWKMYDTDGTTILHTVVDTITYQNDIFESTRTRVII